MSRDLNPAKALIFRITHRDNVPWILANGLHCANSAVRDPNFVEIGNPDLISKRRTWPVPIAPGGTLGDYVPFYFTPWSPMMYNIKTGYNGISRRSNSEIVILISSLHQLSRQGTPFLFTDRHARLKAANFYDDLARLDAIGWANLQARDFRKDPDDPDKFHKYEAEALVYQHLPIDGLLGFGCYDTTTAQSVEQQVCASGCGIRVHTNQRWYF
jgi:hypothetical protein